MVGSMRTFVTDRRLGGFFRNFELVFVFAKFWQNLGLVQAYLCLYFEGLDIYSLPSILSQTLWVLMKFLIHAHDFAGYCKYRIFEDFVEVL